MDPSSASYENDINMEPKSDGMNQVQRIVKNIGVTGLAQVLTSLMAFILLIYLARILGEADFGIYNFAMSVTALFVVITDLGVNQLLVREIARERDRSSEYVNSAVTLKIPLSIMTFIGIVLFSWIFRYGDKVVILLYLLGLYNILLTVSSTYLSLFQAWEKMEYVATFQIIEKIIVVSLGLYVLILGYGVVAIGCVYLIAGFFDICVALLISKRIVKHELDFNLKFQKSILIKALPLAVGSIFSIVFFRIDSVILGFLKGYAAVGIYTAAYNPLLTLSSIIGGMFSSALYPVMSRYFRKDRNSLQKLIETSSKYIALIGMPITVFLITAADKVIFILYGGKYHDSIICFQILSFFIVFRLMNPTIGTFLIAIEKQNVQVPIIVLTAVFNVILNLILIPEFSYIAASISTVLSEMMLYYLFTYFIKKYHGPTKIHSQIIKPFIASVPMAAVISLLDTPLIIPVAVLVYLGCLLLLKALDEDDMKIIRSVLSF